MTLQQPFNKMASVCAEQNKDCMLGSWRKYLNNCVFCTLLNSWLVGSQIRLDAMLHVYISAYQQAANSRLCKEATRDVSMAHQAPCVWGLCHSTNKSLCQMALKHVFRSLICGLFYLQVLRCQVTTFASNFVLHSSTQMCKLKIPCVIAECHFWLRGQVLYQVAQSGITSNSASITLQYRFEYWHNYLMQIIPWIMLKHIITSLLSL